MKNEVNSDLSGKKLVGTVKEIIKPGTINSNGQANKTWKLKVYIEPLHHDITDNEELPLYNIRRSLFRGASSKVGYYSIPRVGSKVVVEFENGDEKSGSVIGEYLDYSSLTDNKYLPNSLGENENNYGWQDEHGNYFVVLSNGDLLLDLKEDATSEKLSIETEQQKINISTKSGDFNVLSETGKITIETGQSTIILNSNGNIEITDSVKVTINTPVVKITGDLIVDKNLEVGEAAVISGPTSMKNSASVDGNLTINGKLWTDHTHAAGSLMAPNGPVSGSTSTANA